MKNPTTRKSPEIGRQSGVSLIELMVAIVIASLLVFGLIQIFGASRASSQTQEGLSRVQENGRFATQYMQRQLRMIGFMGCGADIGRIAQDSFVNHFSIFPGTVVPAGDAYRFQRPIQAFSVGVGTAPAELSDVAATFTADSDVLIVRVFSEESAPIVSITKTANVLNAVISQADSAFLPTPGSQAVLGMQNCRSADVFAGQLSGTGVGSEVIVNGEAAPNLYLDPTCANCAWDYRISNANMNAKTLVGDSSLNGEIHRAEYMAMYVAPGANGNPSLFVRRFERDGVGLGAPEELVDGVENMQLRFGYDNSPTIDGMVDEYRDAAGVTAGATDPVILDDNWRRVLSVRVGLLLRSPDPAAVGTRTYDLLGVTLTPADDGAMRQVYETTIALRNRLFNS